MLPLTDASEVNLPWLSEFVSIAHMQSIKIYCHCTKLNTGSQQGGVGPDFSGCCRPFSSDGAGF